MGNYQLTHKAEDDLHNCFVYGVENFGLDRAVEYLTTLHHKFLALADNPMLGLDASEIAPHTRRFSQGQHIIFYQIDDTGVLIARILRKEMDFKQHV